MWDLPGPGLEPTSPELAGGFLTTAPPGKLPICLLIGRATESYSKENGYREEWKIGATFVIGLIYLVSKPKHF